MLNKPWTDSYDPWFKPSLTYPEKTMYEMIAATAKNYPAYTALDFLGTKISYKDLLQEIDHTASVLIGLGFGAGEVATICLPNIPHAVIAFYAINKVGGICNMVHPLSPAEELTRYLQHTKSRWLFLLDAFFPKHTQVTGVNGSLFTIVCSVGDYLKPLTKWGFYLAKGRKISPVPTRKGLVKWRDFLSSKQVADTLEKQVNKAESKVDSNRLSAHDCAVYLHSGGTTGEPKTIMLSSHSFNILAYQALQIVGFNTDDEFEPAGMSMVTILPLFHGFGLCMGLHAMMVHGLCSILVPQFSPEDLAKIIKKNKPSFIAAVPTLIEGILHSPSLAEADLSCLKAVFCGGDTLPAELKERFDNFIRERGASISLREGYGLTETVTVCAVNPELKSKINTVGLPLADVLMKIVKPNTDTELPIGKSGEICVHAPMTMLGYLDDPEATAETIRKHHDGLEWVHTGDYGYMDKNGYFYFQQRLKRILKVSGVPVFPSQIEEVLTEIKGIRMVCAVGKPHPYKMEVVKLFIVPEDDVKDLERLKEKILATAERKLIRYAKPQEIEFRQELPLTKVGKVDYVTLEKEEKAKAARDVKE